MSHRVEISDDKTMEGYCPECGCDHFHNHYDGHKRRSRLRNRIGRNKGCVDLPHETPQNKTRRLQTHRMEGCEVKHG